jgi:hypothetical protein
MHRFQYQIAKSSHDEALREAAERRRAGATRSTAPIVGQKSTTRQVRPPRGLGRLRPANRW